MVERAAETFQRVPKGSSRGWRRSRPIQLQDFLYLVEELRSVPLGEYTQSETPILTSMWMPFREALETPAQQRRRNTTQ